jgi:hypothetical protein
MYSLAHQESIMSASSRSLCPNLGALALSAAFTAAPLSAQAQTPAAGNATAEGGVPVVVIVKVPKPWYAPKAVVTGKMRDTIPEYARLNGLAFKAFSFEQQSGDYGGVYYWVDAARAQWQERVRKTYGQDAKIEWFDAPILLPTQSASNTVRAGAIVMATP